MQQILIRYLSGERINQVDSFSVDGSEDLIAGRDPLAKIRFDSQDDLVSRQHVRIAQDAENPAAFRLIDLQSRNGTFVNQRRVYGSTFLNHNDKVQLGPSGPEFRFELDPPPVSLNGNSHPGVQAEMTVMPTREIFPFSGTREVGAIGRPIGRATVERMLDDTFGLLKDESNKAFTVGLICLGAVLIFGIAIWGYMRRTSMEAQAARVESQRGIAAVLHATEKQAAATSQINGQIAGLDNQVKRAEQKSQAGLNSLSERMAALKRSQDAEIAAQRGTQQMTAAAQAGATQPPGATELSFGQLLDRVNLFVKQDRYPEALDVSRQLMRIEPNRFEGYFYAGVSAFHQQQFRLASDYLRQAEPKAPADQRADIDRLLAAAQQIGTKEK